MNRLFIRISAAILGLAAASCADDKFYLPGDPGEGEADIAVTATFKSYGTALDQSRTAGNALDKIHNLSVLVYDQNGEHLVDSRSFTAQELTHDSNSDTPNDGENVDITVATDKVKFQLPNLNYGKYKIYVVANADISNKDVSTEEKLKSISFEWNKTDISANDQMFGWFEDKEPGEINAKGLDAPVVTINRPNMELNAWLVRLASKVTVAYDATNLKEDVTIFLQDVRIKDIPKECALGLTNTPDNADDLIADGEMIKYYEGDAPNIESFTYDDWPAFLVNGSTYGSDHTHNADALFFYENMQGTGVDKAQDADGDGKIDSPNSNNPDDPDYKDQKKFGTYIEVTAYYISKSPERPGKGKIVYRFMLGKDVLKNYDAQRNYHYKLTLKFNGWANDVDWHIEFEPDPEMKLPNPYFISYLYDKSAVIPVEITGKIKEGTKLKAEIIENGWWPVEYDEEAAKIDPEKVVIKDAPESQYYKEAVDKKKVWNGFLSLRDTGHTTEIGGDIDDAAKANAENEKYWTEKKRGWREYSTTPGSNNTAASYNEDNDGEYTVATDPNNKDITIFNIPYYTRAKNLVKVSGYTGNNPYVSYQRYAKVKFTASILNPVTGNYQDYSKEVYIIQVRRIVNPKGIWRAYNETKPFLVHLMRLTTEYTTDPWNSDGEFKDFTSIGPWSAEVMVQGGYKNGAPTSEPWINLSEESGSSKKEGDKIMGESGSSIKFNYAPQNALTNKNDVRYGIIKVRYHNYTCEHLIFVRQGYAPIPVASNPDATHWYSFNLQTEQEMATSPCDEGSLFKRFRADVPIRSQNNTEFYFQETPGNLDICYRTNDGYKWTLPWNGWDTPPTATSFPEMTERNTKEKMKVASVDDYLELYNDPKVQYGFGILYDGTATGVQESVKKAYSYYGKWVNLSNGIEQTKNYEDGCGMRGCFVYNEETGAQIFLPIGAAGYGRRRQNSHPISDASPGMLIYANRNEAIANAGNLPLLYDLYRRPGAIYWCNEMKEGEVLGNGQAKDCVAWDFNYITFDFFPSSKEMVLTTSDSDPTVRTPTDALRIRCVVPETSKKPSPPQTE